MCWLFGAGAVLRAGNFTVMQWTGDATSGIVPGRTVWAYNLGTSYLALINGVVLPGVAGPNPLVTGQFLLNGTGLVYNAPFTGWGPLGPGSTYIDRDFV